MAGRRRSMVSKRAQQRRERTAAFAQTIPKERKRSVGISTTSETPMHVRALGVELEPGLREYVRSRASGKLAKFGLAITRMSVRFEDLSGPTGAPVIECRFKVVLRQAPDVVVSARGESARTALNLAVASVERAVRRTLQRGVTSRSRSRGQ